MKEKENQDCSLVRDLLPSYIHEICNKVTNNFIINHLQECNECKESYEKL